MSKNRPGNFQHNYPLLIKYLDEKGYEYYEYSDGQHIKILGYTAYIELWPSRMTYHIIESEYLVGSKHSGYNRLDFNFNEKQLEELLTKV